jgi:glycosyltransferase involved in cell wall biosynthesis
MMPEKVIVGIDVRLVTEERTGDSMVFRYLTRALLASSETGFLYRLYTHVVDEESLQRLKELLDCTERDDVEIVSLSGSSNRFIWNGYSLPRELQRRPVDIYHTQYIAPLWLPRKTKLVTHVHDISFAAHPEWIAPKDRFFLHLLIPRSLKRSDLLIVPSDFTRTEIEEYYPAMRGKIKVVPNAVGEEWLRSENDETIKLEVQKKYNLTKRYIVAAGTMQPRKNIPYLIQLWKERPASLQEVGLVLTGNPMGHHVDERIDSRDQSGIIFTGYVDIDELRAIVAGAEILAFPSLYEGFGIPLLEAFATGVPVLASDIPPFREVGALAIAYIDPRNLAHGKEVLYSLLIDEARKKRLVEAGRSRLALYNWEKSALLLSEAYQSLSGVKH